MTDKLVDIHFILYLIITGNHSSRSLVPTMVVRTDRLRAVLEDDAGADTGGERDNVLYQVEPENGIEMDFQRHDLRPY